MECHYCGGKIMRIDNGKMTYRFCENYDGTEPHYATIEIILTIEPTEPGSDQE